MTDNGITKSYQYANRRIIDMLGKLGRKGICGCCTGRAMVDHAAMLCELTMGSDRAADFLSKIVAEMREHNVPEPDHEVRH